MEEYKSLNPHLARRIDKFIDVVNKIEKEVLIYGKVPASAIFNPSSLKSVMVMGRSARVIQVVGILFTAYDLEQATEQSFKAKSIKPISAEVVRQAGGWGGAAAGFKIGAAVGASLGVETGPGLFVTGLVGGIVCGAAGYYGAGWIADYIYKN